MKAYESNRLARHDWLPLQRVGDHLGGRLDQGPSVLSRDGREDQALSCVWHL